MRVAVRQRRALEDTAGGAQRLDDLRRRLPDELAAEERQFFLVDPVALHRVEDVVERQPVGPAGVEVLEAVGRRRVDDAGAVVGGGVVGEVDRREAVVAGIDGGERMAELQAVELLAERGGGSPCPRARSAPGTSRPSALASRSRPRSVSTRAYSSLGLRLSAWLAGKVHGVVVQMTAKASLLSASSPNAVASAAGSSARKPTSMVVDLRSAYSISNSASDEPQSKHQ